MRITNRKIVGGLTVGWILVAVNHFSTNLGRPLDVWDEQIYFNAAKNVLDGHVMLPRFTLESHPLPVLDPFLHKPPLVYWIQAAAMALGGETPGIARWPSVIAMSGVVGLTVLLAWRLSGLIAATLAGGVALQMGALKWTHAANDVATDPFLLLFGFSALYCLVRFVDTGDNRWAWASGAGYGLTIMTKSVAAAPFGLFALPYLYFHRQQVGWQGFGRVAVGGVVVTAPWFLIAASVAFSELLNQMFFNQVVARATGEKFVEQGGLFPFMRFPYFTRAPNYFGWPFYGLGLAAVVSLGSRVVTGQWNDLTILMWPLAIGVICLYAIIGGNHGWYVMPAAVPITLLVSDAIATTLKHGLDIAGTIVALRLRSL